MISVTILTPARAKYVVRRSMHPFGNEGDCMGPYSQYMRQTRCTSALRTQACDGLGLHSKAYRGQYPSDICSAQWTYVNKYCHNSEDCHEGCHSVDLVAELRSLENTMVQSKNASFDEEQRQRIHDLEEIEVFQRRQPHVREV